MFFRTNPPQSDVPDAGIISEIASALPNPFSNPLPEVAVPRAYDKTNSYNFENRRRGLCVIINNVEFDAALELNDRSGSDADASNLQTRFDALGFVVKNYRNVRTREMQTLLRDGTNLRAIHNFFATAVSLINRT